MQTPQISIIIPVYNSEKFIKECLESVKQQTFKNIEIVCVNDGSTDNSSNIINEIAEKDKRIILLEQENKGVSVARNNALMVAKAPYIMFVDSDDSLSSDACEIAYNTIIRDDSDVVIYCCALEYNGVSAPKYAFGKNEKVFNAEECRNVLYRRCFGLLPDELNIIEQQDYLSSVCLKMYKKSIIDKNNMTFIDIREIGSYEDGLFNLKYFSYIKKATYIPAVLYHYRRDNEESNTSKYKNKLNSQWLELFRYIKNEIDEKKLPESFQTAFDNRQAISIMGLGLNAIFCQCSFIKKVKLIKEIISKKEYRAVIKKLELKAMAIHWKIFFLCAKLNFSFPVTILLIIMNKLRRR